MSTPERRAFDRLETQEPGLAARINQLAIQIFTVEQARPGVAEQATVAYLVAARAIWGATPAAHSPAVRGELARIACALVSGGSCDDGCFRFVDREIIGAA